MAKKENKSTKNKTSFMKSLRAELKKVIWPTPKQLFNNTVAVIVIVLITTLIVFLLDLAFESLNTHGVNKIKNIVANSSVTNDSTNSSDGNTTIESGNNITESTTAQNDSSEAENTDNTTIDTESSNSSSNESSDNENNVETTANNSSEESSQEN